jgi:hypothetical protein
LGKQILLLHKLIFLLVLQLFEMETTCTSGVDVFPNKFRDDRNIRKAWEKPPPLKTPPPKAPCAPPEYDIADDVPTVQSGSAWVLAPPQGLAPDSPGLATVPAPPLSLNKIPGPPPPWAVSLQHRMDMLDGRMNDLFTNMQEVHNNVMELNGSTRMLLGYVERLNTNVVEVLQQFENEINYALAPIDEGDEATTGGSTSSASFQ